MARKEEQARWNSSNDEQHMIQWIKAVSCRRVLQRLGLQLQDSSTRNKCSALSSRHWLSFFLTLSFFQKHSRSKYSLFNCELIGIFCSDISALIFFHSSGAASTLASQLSFSCQTTPTLRTWTWISFPLITAGPLRGTHQWTTAPWPFVYLN